MMSDSSEFSPKALAFDALVRSRFAEKGFSPDPVPRNTLRHLVELTQLSPSSWNMQPFRIILAQNAQMRTAIAERAMLGGNVDTVKSAPLLAVFVADNDPAQSARKLVELERKQQQEFRKGGGATQTDGRGMLATASVFFARGWLARRALQLGSHLMSPITPSPKLGFSTEEWASKNVGLAAMTFMLAASSHDLISCPMEGFDERRLKGLLAIPDKGYHVPLVVAVGFPRNAATEQQKAREHNSGAEKIDVSSAATEAASQRLRRVRFPLEHICFGEKFGMPADL